MDRTAPRGAEVHAVQQFHDVIELSGFAHAEVVQPDGIRRAEARDCPRFELKASNRRFPRSLLEHLRANQLDGCGPCQELMCGSPDLSHASVSDSFEETIVSERKAFVEQVLVHLQHAAAGRCGGAFDHVLQLADVAWPSVGAQTLHRLFTNGLDDGAQPASMLPREESGEFRNVLTPFDQ